MTLPKTILNIVRVIQKRLEISPSKDKIFPFSAWDFRDENRNTIPKPDLKSGLRQLAEDEKVLQLRNAQCLDRRGRFDNDNFELEVSRERFAEFYEKHQQDILKSYEKAKQTIVPDSKDAKGKIKKERLLITRDKINGDFYYKNKLLEFENKKAIYYLIFECLYEKGDFNGFCSYETINEYLEERGKKELTDDRRIKDRIKNGVESLFRFSDLHRKAPDGKNSIQKVRGDGISLYNPPV